MTPASSSQASTVPGPGPGPVAGPVAGPAASPVVVEVVRSGFVEGRHHGRLVALDDAGDPVVEIGDCRSPILPRSANKPLQAVGMLECGLAEVLGSAADRDELLAVVAASHSGTPDHVALVRRLLERAGLDESALGNTPGLPLDAESALAWQCSGGGPDRLRQNCSGKHAGMLVTCRAAGWPIASYLEPGHPLQQALAATVARLAGEPVASVAVDGCGAPLLAISLAGLARAFGALAVAPEGTAEHRVGAAMRVHPDAVGGPGRDVTAFMRAVPGLLAKDGAEGVYAAALPGGASVALKVDDGAGRARPLLLAAGLRRLGVPAASVAVFAEAPVLGHGVPVGAIRVSHPDLA